MAEKDNLREAENGDLVKLRKWNWTGYTIAEGGNIEDAPRLSGVTSEEHTLYTRYGQKLLLEKLKKIEAGTYDIIGLPSLAQFRTCRHIVSGTVFDGTRERYDDAIGICGDFRKRGPRFQIPFSSLFHPSYPNLIAAGRIISAEGEGWEISRVIPVCALTGEAAGTAAALAVKSGSFSSLSVKTLQKRLVDNGVRLS